MTAYTVFIGSMTVRAGGTPDGSKAVAQVVCECVILDSSKNILRASTGETLPGPAAGVFSLMTAEGLEPTDTVQTLRDKLTARLLKDYPYLGNWPTNSYRIVWCDFGGIL